MKRTEKTRTAMNYKIDEKIFCSDGKFVHVKVEMEDGLKGWLCRRLGIGGAGYRIWVEQTDAPKTRRAGSDNGQSEDCRSIWERL